MHNQKILPAIRQRRSHRSFQDQPVEPEKLKAILFAAMCAPSAHNKRAWEFVKVDKPELIKQLSQATAWSGFLAQASVVIVVCSPQWENWLEDASVVATHIYLEATHQGLATCWTQLRQAQTPQGDSAEDYVRQLLDIPAEMRVLCLMPLGYPAQSKSEHDQAKFEQNKVHRNQW